MSWKVPPFWVGNQSQGPQNYQQVPSQSWYPPPSVGNSPSRPSTSSSSSGVTSHQRPFDRPQLSSSGMPSPAEAAGVIACLKDKSVDELRYLLTDKEAYRAFFNSLDQVKLQNKVRDDLREETLQLAKKNLEQESRILELKNQCTIIRTTELATAQERLAELEKQKDDILKSYSPIAILEKLQEAINKVDAESDMLHHQLLAKEIDLATFIQRYKKLRNIYHRRSLLHLAAKTSVL